MSGPIASAVVLPDADSPPTSPSHTLKRRQSSVASENAKRPRVSDDADTTTTANAPPKRRERGRERRLFGAVLGALSQNPTSAGQKRRSEIEKRQFAQRRQEDEESEQRKAERMARRRVQRVHETRRFERLAMKVRHDNMLHLAHFLCTKAEPRLHYKPWEMTPEEDERIEAQIAEAREAVQREREEFEAREEEERRREQRATPDEWTHRTAVSSDGVKMDADPAKTQADSTNGESHAQDQKMQDDRAEATTNTVEPRPAEEPAMDTAPPEANVDEPSKDADEEVVEAAEDTVIY